MDFRRTLQKMNVEEKVIDLLIRSLKQGKRRLKRALTTTEIQSTNCDKKGATMPVILNEEEMRNKFNNIGNECHTHDIEKTNISYNTNKIVNDVKLLKIDEAASTSKETITYGSLKRHTDKRFNEILSAINFTKRIILHNVETKINEIKQTMPTSCTIEVLTHNLRTTREKLGVVLPIKKIQDFLSFEEAVIASEDKKKALINFYEIIVCDETSIKTCLKKIMTATVSKSIEVEYSAFGRQICGIGKRNFSKTQTYLCLKDVLMKKFNTEEFKTFPYLMSRWLSRATDQERRRKQRNFNLL